jgi:hypothetical protein
MEGFCESCGRHPTRLERARGRGIASCPDECGLYLCPECRHPDPLDAFPLGPTDTTRSSEESIPVDAGGWRWQPTAAAGIVAVVGVGILVIGGAVLATTGRPGPTGEVLSAVATPRPTVAETRQPSSAAGAGGATTSRPSPAGELSATITPSATTTPSAATSSATPVPASTQVPSPVSGAQVSVDAPVLHVWRGAYGELRLQVIVRVRNTGSDWAALTRAASTYQVLDGRGRVSTSGVFTAALPEVVAPGGQSFLVDTVSVAFGRPADYISARADIHTGPAVEPRDLLVVSGVQISTSAEGGLRAVGEIQNAGDLVARSIIAGVVVLDPEGRPLAAVYDLTDTGDLNPGASIRFDTDYPGAPPVDGGSNASLIGLAFTPAQ